MFGTGGGGGRAGRGGRLLTVCPPLPSLSSRALPAPREMSHLCFVPKANRTEVSPPWMLPEDGLFAVIPAPVASQSGTQAPRSFALLLPLTVGPRETRRADANLLTLLGGKGKKEKKIHQVRNLLEKNQSLKTCLAEGQSLEASRMGKALGSPSFLDLRALHLRQPSLTLGSALVLKSRMPGRGTSMAPGPAAPHTGDPRRRKRAPHSPEPRLGCPAGPAPEVGSWAWPWAAPWSPGGQRSEFFQDDPGRRARHRRRRPRRPSGGGGSRLPSRRGLCRRGGEVITAAEGRSRGRSGSGRRGQRRPSPQGERVGPRRIASAHCCPVRSGAAPGSGRLGVRLATPLPGRPGRAREIPRTGTARVSPAPSLARQFPGFQPWEAGGGDGTWGGD